MKNGDIVELIKAAGAAIGAIAPLIKRPESAQPVYNVYNTVYATVNNAPPSDIYVFLFD